MAILVNRATKVVVQGITGREGSSHTRQMLAYGTAIVAGVTPQKGGGAVEGVPVYDSMREALRKHPEVDTSIIFVPAPFASDAVYEAVDGGIELLVIITERVPVHDSMKFLEYARVRGVRIVGPNCPGVISPRESKVGIMPGHIFAKGPVGMVSRSGTLTYEIAWALTRAGLGQSTAIGIGGDPMTGMDFNGVLSLFEEDDETKAIVLIGEIGGDAEERFAKRVKDAGLKKPVIALVAGRTAPPGKRMGHAGAIVTLGAGTAEAKRKALVDAGIVVADLPSQIPELVRRVMPS